MFISFAKVLFTFRLLIHSQRIAIFLSFLSQISWSTCICSTHLPIFWNLFDLALVTNDLRLFIIFAYLHFALTISSVMFGELALLSWAFYLLNFSSKAILRWDTFNRRTPRQRGSDFPVSYLSFSYVNPTEVRLNRDFNRVSSLAFSLLVIS